MPASLFLVHLSLTGLFLYSQLRRYPEPWLRRMFLAGITAKLLAGVALGLLYTYYYPYSGDTFNYHREASLLADWGKEHSVGYVRFVVTGSTSVPSFPNQISFVNQPRALFFAKLVSIIHLFTDNNYWLTGLYFSLFSFLGSWHAAYTLSRLYPARRRAAFFSFLFIPSVVFWTAGLLKESLSMGIIGFTGGLVLNYRTGRLSLKNMADIGRLLFLLLGLWILWQIKYYYFAVLAACLAAALLADPLIRRLRIRQWSGQWLLFESVLICLLLLATVSHPSLTLSYFLPSVIQNHNAHITVQQADASITYPDLQPTIPSFVFHSGKALLAGLFRPFVWEAENALQKAAAIENLLLLALTLVAIISFFKCKLIASDLMLVLATIHFVVMLTVLLAFSAPNFGELNRYRSVVLPFLSYLLLSVLPARKKLLHQ